MRKEVIRKLLAAGCAAVALCSAASLGVIGWQYAQAGAISHEAREEFTIEPEAVPLAEAPAAAEAPTPGPAPTEPPAPPAPPRIDFAALSAESADAVGWLWIGGTGISYPVVQGSDNERYLHTAYNGEKSYAGSIFLDSRNAADLSDANTIVYGHNMKDRSMFGTLKNYRDQDFADAHRTIYLLTPEGKRRYEVFAVYEAADDDRCYTRTFESAEARENAARRAASRSEIRSDATASDRWLTLSTCTAQDDCRLVVQAYYAGTEE